MADADHSARLLLRPDGTFRAVCACNWTNDTGVSVAADRATALAHAGAVADAHDSTPRRVARRLHRKA